MPLGKTLTSFNITLENELLLWHNIFLVEYCLMCKQTPSHLTISVCTDCANYRCRVDYSVSSINYIRNLIELYTVAVYNRIIAREKVLVFKLSPPK